MGDDEEQIYEVQYTDGGEVPKNKGWISRAGTARVTYVNKDTFEGSFNENRTRHGYGVYTWNVANLEEFVQALEDSGAKEGEINNRSMKYEGSWQFGKKHGMGKLSYPDNSVYQGMWFNGKRHGMGTYTYPNGDKFSGSWVEGQRHGMGAYVVPSQKYQLVGEWVQGQHKRGQWLMDDGSVYEGTFNESGPVEAGTFSFPNGGCERGSFAQEPDLENEEKMNCLWTAADQSTAAAPAADMSRALPAGKSAPPKVPMLKKVEKLRISAVAGGVITIQNAGALPADLQYLNIEHASGDTTKAVYNFAECITLRSGAVCRVYTGAAAALGPKPPVGEDADMDAPDDGSKDVVWTSEDILNPLGEVHLSWTDAYGSRVWLCTKHDDGSHSHAYMEENAGGGGDDEDDDDM